MVIREPQATGSTILQPEVCNSGGDIRAQVPHFKISPHWTKLHHCFLMSSKHTVKQNKGALTFIPAMLQDRYTVNSILLLGVIWIMNTCPNTNGELFSGFKDLRIGY